MCTLKCVQHALDAELYNKGLLGTHCNFASLLTLSHLGHDNPLHPGNMSSLIRLVSAALERPQALCGEGPKREAYVATGGTRPGQR